MGVIDLTGKAALVTGGSRGIGEATVRLLAGSGARVVFTYRSRAPEARRVEKAVRAGGGGEAWGVQADLGRREDCRGMVEEALGLLGRLDLFVANAGIWLPEPVPVRDLGEERWRETLAVNLDGVFYATREVLRRMGPGGRIVLVSSTAGQRGEAYHADYAASKGAVIAFVKSVAVEAAPDIAVNAVAPGWVDTEMCAVPFGRGGGAGRREIEASIPLGRVAGPEDVAGPILFLLSSLARHVTGEVVNVNGGSVLCG